MSLPKPKTQGGFLDVSFLADELFDETDDYRLFQEKVLPVLRSHRGELAGMYCADNGRRAIEPVVLLGVSLLQFMKKVPDREAADQVRLNLGWKFALDLPLDDPGFHPTSLVVFRERLKESEQGRLVFDAIIQVLQESGLVKRRSKQRLDSTHVLGCVAQMSRLDVVRETVRQALDEIEKRGMSDELPCWKRLIERYRESQIDWRHQSGEHLCEKARQAGEDALELIRWHRQQPAAVRDSEKSLLLERVFLEQYDLNEEPQQRRRSEHGGTVQNPHDPEAQWSAKGQNSQKTWVGYKVQVMETVAEDPTAKKKGDPTEQFITEIVTTEAAQSEMEGMRQVMESQQAHGQEAPSELFVDAAYVSGETLAQAQAEGRELVGPALPSAAQSPIEYRSDHFDVDLAAGKAVCPAGQTSTQWSHVCESRGEEYYRIEWGRQCDECEKRKECTRSKSGRRTLNVGIHHDLLQARRREMQTEAFALRMHQRNSIEGTISELTRGGMRRTRYRGLAKTRLANYFIAAACNVKRWLRLTAWQMETVPVMG
jgi:transposase